MRQTLNKVNVTGILQEIDLSERTFKKNGVDTPCISGSITLRVKQLDKTKNEEVNSEIPVHFFAAKVTNKGTPNPVYDNLQKLMREGRSIAATGSEDMADKITINPNANTSGDVRMNEYYGANGTLISFPRVHASFFRSVNENSFVPDANFQNEIIILDQGYEVGTNGEETGRYFIKGGIVQYNGILDIVPFYIENPNVINAVTQYWKTNDTVLASGKLRFTVVSKSESAVNEDSYFGEVPQAASTRPISEFIITGGSPEPLDGEFAFTLEEIKELVAARTASLEARKEQDMSRTHRKAAPSINTDDMGF